MPSEMRCECGGPLLPLVFSDGWKDRFGGRVCATCREEDWLADERDQDLACRCAEPDAVSIRWMGRRYFVGEGCLNCRLISWRMDEPSAELHYITDGIANT